MNYVLFTGLIELGRAIFFYHGATTPSLARPSLILRLLNHIQTHHNR